MASIPCSDAKPFFLESHFLADVLVITVSPKNNNWSIVMKDDYRIYDVPCNRNIFFAALPCLCQNASLHASLCIFLCPQTGLVHILHASFECFHKLKIFSLLMRLNYLHEYLCKLLEGWIIPILARLVTISAFYQKF